MSSAEGSSNSQYGSPEQTFFARKSSPDLLRHVLEETLARGEQGMTLDEWRAIQMIARTHIHSKHELPLEHITQILVEGLLSTRFPELADSENRKRMSQTISASLCTDPTSRERIKVFWKQLRESLT